MVGTAAALPAGFAPPPARVRLFEDGAFLPLGYLDHYGPEIGFGHLLAESSPDDEIVICRVALDGSNLYYDWRPHCTAGGPEDDYRGPLYPKLWKAGRPGTGPLPGSRGGSSAGCHALDAGEADCRFDFMAAAYQDNLAGLIEAVRADAGQPDLPFLIGQICPTAD